jgi:hypothetical protein
MNAPLSEKDFIQEGYSKNPFPLWLCLFLLAVVMAIFWGGNSWYHSKMNQEIKESPFLQVTNREFSVFLWQFPEHMRNNVKAKTGYLTGFQPQEKIGPFLNEVDHFVVAPPELLFLYHTWKRLLSPEFDPRPISLDEFISFLNEAEEWKPDHWPQAPNAYKDLIQALSQTNTPKDLQTLPLNTLPIEIRQSFQGWKNFYLEGDLIDKLTLTYSQIHEFLAKHPHYARSYWRNIVAETTPNYLSSVREEKNSSSFKVPDNEITAFLKVACFNYLQGKENK